MVRNSIHVIQFASVTVPVLRYEDRRIIIRIFYPLQQFSETPRHHLTSKTFKKSPKSIRKGARDFEKEITFSHGARLLGHFGSNSDRTSASLEEVGVFGKEPRWHNEVV